jgi:hypothetical protein
MKRIIPVLVAIGAAVLMIGGVALAAAIEGTSADDITSANSRASRDVVSCGGGTDKVVADSLDEVDKAACENVRTVSGGALSEDARAYAAEYGVSARKPFAGWSSRRM